MMRRKIRRNEKLRSLIRRNQKLRSLKRIQLLGKVTNLLMALRTQRIKSQRSNNHPSTKRRLLPWSIKSLSFTNNNYSLVSPDCQCLISKLFWMNTISNISRMKRSSSQLNDINDNMLKILRLVKPYLPNNNH
jgi:hypothetical protein